MDNLAFRQQDAEGAEPLSPVYQEAQASNEITLLDRIRQT